MQELIEFLRTHSSLVLANPIAFATFAIIFGSGGFLVGRYFLAERIANLESRIARRDDELAEFKTGRPSAKEPEPSMVPLIGTTATGGTDGNPPLGRLATGTKERAGGWPAPLGERVG
ncbi:hypothetical protein [Mesorhizobium sp.]|uniref:hypothetical protein n=1 Tax=Mesorhizobium sp. TaxID=1871066 RepID=UPI0025809827|nr:hypothetical protein [Mesorhizobium sp.]